MSKKEQGPEEPGSLTRIASLVASASPQGINDIIDRTRDELAADNLRTLESYREGGLEKVAAGKWEQIKDVGSGMRKDRWVGCEAGQRPLHPRLSWVLLRHLVRSLHWLQLVCITITPTEFQHICLL